MLITSTPMTDVLPSIGLRVLQQFANAQIDFGAGAVVMGVLSDEPADLLLGGMHVAARRKRFICMVADLLAADPSAATGSPCTLAGVLWRIADPGLTHHDLTGQVSFVLERDA